ncbi:MAG: DUF1837 domain-containing protein [Nitrospinae bacterium]|nr:DUF1837 domain-containing protein [Nitrospinota bacterium]
MEVSHLTDIIDDIGRGKASSIDAYLRTIEYAVELKETKANFYSHMITLNGNGDIRLDDFIDFIIRHIVEYVIPRSKILEAKEKDTESGLSTHIARLMIEAKKLFTPLKKTGEGGEMLLFILGEVLLNLPQLFCKMSVKTAGGVHFHGADGIHAGVDDEGKIELYWGESKFHSTFDSAISDCLDSIRPILKREDDADYEDLLLLQKYSDLGNEENTIIIKHILDKDNPEFNEVRYCGLCLIGFNENLYTPEHTDEIIKKNFEGWKKSISKRLKYRNLEEFKIHLFCLPVVSVKEFRERFLQRLGI